MIISSYKAGVSCVTTEINLQSLRHQGQNESRSESQVKTYTFASDTGYQVAITVYFCLTNFSYTFLGELKGQCLECSFFSDLWKENAAAWSLFTRPDEKTDRKTHP